MLDSLQTHELDGKVVLWDPVRGRGLWGPRSSGMALRIARWGDVDARTGIWCHHRASLRVPGGVWAPDPSRAGSDGHPFRLVPLSIDEGRVLDAVNGARTGEQLAVRANVPLSLLDSLAPKLTAFDVQALQLRPRPPSPRDRGLRHVLGRSRVPNKRTPDQHDRSGNTDLLAYHEESITDGSTHFDDRETTFAHTFGLPHPALRGQRYGERLREVLRDRGWPVDGPVVELGCGTGELALGWGPPTHGEYRRYDLSPELLRVQQIAAPWSTGTRADLTDLPLANRSVPLVICNEVLADLTASRVESVDPSTEVFRKEVGLAQLPGGFYNPGAWRAVVEAARVLEPGGYGLFTEFGVEEGEVEEAVQLDHPEVGVHFGQLVQVAKRCGLEAELLRLDDLIQPHTEGRWLARHSWLAVRSWADSRGVRLQARAWTPQTLAAELPDVVDGLDWVPLTDDGPGPLMTRFYALMLHLPPRPGKTMG